MTAKRETRARLELEINDDGLGSVLVDGVELAWAVTRAIVTMSAGESPRVELHIRPGYVTVGVDGMITLVEDAS